MATSNQHFQLLFLALVLVLGQWASLVSSARPLNHEELSMRERHERWMARHGRVYKDDFEKENRFHIFQNNVKRIDDFNNDVNHKNSYTLGVNAFSDLTIDEVRATYTGYKSNPSILNSKLTGFRYENLTTDDSTSVDWRAMGAVTDVKNQGQCGCCWAFSVVAAVEGLNMITNQKLVTLSEQQLLDCDTNEHGCDGGDMETAFEYIQQSQGLAMYSEYPYQGVQGQCASESEGGVTITGYEKVPEGDENALKQAVSQQPISIGIDGGDSYFVQYEGGVFEGPCGSDINHAVTIVGYGTDDQTGYDYWLIKNSWGETWGESGYMKILRGQNLCGLASHASYPVM